MSAAEGLCATSVENNSFSRSGLDSLVKTSIVDGQILEVPSVDARLIRVHNGDLHTPKVAVGRCILILRYANRQRLRDAPGRQSKAILMALVTP